MYVFLYLNVNVNFRKLWRHEHLLLHCVANVVASLRTLRKHILYLSWYCSTKQAISRVRQERTELCLLAEFPDHNKWFKLICALCSFLSNQSIFYEFEFMKPPFLCKLRQRLLFWPCEYVAFVERVQISIRVWCTDPFNSDILGLMLLVGLNSSSDGSESDISLDDSDYSGQHPYGSATSESDNSDD